MAVKHRSFSFEPEILDRLREESEKTGIPQSVIIRQALAVRWETSESR
jgi:predicted DNA-binding protein